ncbi:MAG TPA: ATP-binding protein [Candidatus Kryptonia bacterium]
MESVTVGDLKKVIALRDLPDEHLRWILDHTEYCEYADGDLIAKYGDEADVMWITLEGKVVFYMYVNGRQVYYFTFENNNLSGGVGGLLPYSRMKTSPGYSYASGDVKVLKLNKKYFHDLETLNPDFIQRLIGYMTERARVFATTQLQYEKVNALGNLAAGIAHELNNPAAAISQISDELEKRLDRNYELTRELLGSGVEPGQIKSIHSLVEKREASLDNKNKLTTLELMENEDELADWLEQSGFRDREAAETFSESGFSASELQNILNDLGRDAFVLVIPWLENLLSSYRIVKDLKAASNRISKLVGSIKSHVNMDRTSDLQPTNIHKDIDDTLTLLGFKLRKKNIYVKKKFSEGMPAVPAYVGELNQVWTNLIDNAIFAMGNDGELSIETTHDNKEVTVRITDNGSGIPKEIISRIFDPFFTTKKVGEGTGIGLDIVSRVVKRHNGRIEVKSEPGKTEFAVHIPIEHKVEPNQEEG